MASERTHGTWVIILSVLLAGMLAIVPLPEWLEDWRPQWMALVVIYWVIALPHRMGLVTAWCIGFFVDVLQGSLLGLNALTLTLVAYGALSLYQRMRMFTPLQQSLTVLLLWAYSNCCCSGGLPPPTTIPPTI